ncbi:hypothetical protein [Paenibacillus ihumii]|uniref:hypothetical protein n=1 Tax=Paenibacillus ihumii TaxID=687436 RepID=UPI0006D85B9C|nr:hypothetical protein [Paenibacillus ihumii]
MKVSAALPMSGITSGQASIDKQIQMLNRRKEAIFQKIADVIHSDDEQKVKEEKIKALKMEINLIDLQIQQLMKKKMEMEKQKKSAVEMGEAPLPPSPSDLIQPDRQPKQNNGFIDIKL